MTQLNEIASAKLRLVTYNVHGCVGLDGRRSERRIADVLGALAPDLVALQELDVGRARSNGGHQPEQIAADLGMSFLFSPSVRDGDEHYGHALMSRFPLRQVRSAELPRVHWPRASEPRSALWAAVELPAGPMQIICTHLGLSPIERHLQATALRSRDWLTSEEFSGPRVLCGDFNAGPFSMTYQRLRLGGFRDAQGSAWRATPTYPSRMPVLRLDHVFASDELSVETAIVDVSPLARIASDHLPLVVDLTVQPEAA